MGEFLNLLYVGKNFQNVRQNPDAREEQKNKFNKDQVDFPLGGKTTKDINYKIFSQFILTRPDFTQI